MKFTLSLLCCLAFCCLQPVWSQNFDNPSEYLSFINTQNENISKKFMSYSSAAAHGKRLRKVENLRNKLLNEVQEARMNISGMPSFKGDKEYRDTAVNHLKLYFNILNEDYSKVINLEDIAERSYDDMEAYLMAKEMVDKKLDEANEKMKYAQQAFAAKNKITLLQTESRLGEMMKTVGEMNKYYNDIYLIFFKPNIQESHMLEAMDKGNVTGIEQSRNSLLKYSEEGIARLATMKGFQGDNSLLGSCRQLLNFYIREAGEMKNITDFFLSKERFENIKKEFEKSSRRTQESVDAYNKAVNEMNAASGNFNSVNKSLYERRKENIENWNKTVKGFFDDFTPHYK